MKRYPFSKKAVQAILAASLALTPAAGLSAVKAQAAETETVVTYAAYNANDLTAKLNQIYAELKKEENKELLEKIKAAQTKIGAVNWEQYAENIVNSNVNNRDAKVDALAALLKEAAKLATSTSPAELQNNLDQLSSSAAAGAAQFGKDVSAQELKELIIGTALESYNSLKNLNANASEAEINAALENAITTVLTGNLNNPNYKNLLTALLNNISIAEVKKAVSEVLADIDSNGDLRKSLLQVVKKVENGTPGTPGGSDPSPDPDLQPIPYTPGPGEVKVPVNATDIEKETVSGQTQYVTTIAANKVDELVGLISASNNVLVLPLPQAAAGEINKALIPGSLFTKAAAKDVNAALLIKTAEAGYKLPVNEINIAELAQKLGVAADAVQIEISVNIVNENNVNNLNLVSKVIEFTVKAKAGDKELTISTYKTYVERHIVGNKEFDTKHTAAVRLNDNGTFSPVPAVFAGNVGYIKSPTNSKYAIVENDKTFDDVNNGANYFEEHIEKLASKYIINGKNETTYAPSDNITRGEFAALVSRSLGLVAQNPGDKKFSDVSQNQAVNKNGEIIAAVEAGIIKGFPDGTFKPEQPITRAEAAIMIDRALQFTNVPASKFDTSITIAKFKDEANIGSSSRSSIEKVVQAGIMDGFGNGEFGAYKNTQRDQMAKVLDKLLQVANLIN